MALLDRLIRRIALEGPLSVADYMAACLADPRDGYYARRDRTGEPFGREGDFITAPEISQMFGELLGLWCADAWSRLLGAPRPCHMIELGPGRGTLMADALRAAALMPAFLDAARLHLVEISPALIDRQRQALGDRDATWHASFAETPEAPFLLVANEFLDALPVRQFVQTDQGVVERCVGLAANGAGLAFGLAPAPSPWAALLPPALAAAPPGSVLEVSPAALELARAVAARIARQGGVALFIDYGPAASAPGDTLQALRRHQRHPVLEAPGEADLTAHVDFQAIANTAREQGVACYGPVPQGVFLERLGIRARAARLMAGATPEQRATLEAALARLIGEAEMGTLFKALALVTDGRGVPAGFTDQERRA